MKDKSRALKRLGVAGLGAVIALATPAVGFTAMASAAPTDTAAAIQWVAPATNGASVQNDGTNTTVKLSVVQTQTNTGAGNPALGEVRFDYTQTADSSGTPIPVGSQTEVPIAPIATTAPYHIEWTPPSNGTYTLTAEPLSSTGASAGATVTDDGIVVNATHPAVHVSTPADGSTVNFFNTAGDNWIPVSGTRSNGTDGLPEVDVDTALYDMTPGANFGPLDDAIATDAVAAANASPGAGASQAWNGVAQVPTDCPSGDTCDVAVRALVTTGNGSSDEATIGTLAASSQVLSPTGLAVAPTGTVTITATNGDQKGGDQTSQAYTVTATDTAGKPIPHLTLLAFASHGTVTFNGTASHTSSATAASVTTDSNGQGTFTVTDTVVENSTLTFQTAVNGTSYVPANDDQVTGRTLVSAEHVNRVLNQVTLTKTPDKSVYASQSFNAGYPVINACLTDQFGQAFHDKSVLIASDTRTIGATVTNPAVALGSEESTGETPNGCFPVTLNPYPNEEATGNDVITVYEEVNGQNGFQSGSTDIGAVLTVNFAPGVIFFDRYSNCTDNDCETQAQTDTVDTITVGENVGGTPQVGEPLTLTMSGGNSATEDFPANQPAGTNVSVASNKQATCTTGASGTCQVNVSDANVEGIDLNATDTHGLSGDIDVEFRSESVALHTAERGSHWSLIPDGTGGNNATKEEDYGLPGAIMVDNYHLYDVGDTNGQHILADIPVTVHIDHGFFTSVPTDEDDYNTGTFTPAPASAGLVGTPTDIGTPAAGGGETLNLVSNNHGIITFATSIGRDPGFDDDGEVLTDVSVTSNGATANGGNPAGDDGDQDYTWTTNVDDELGSGESCVDNVEGPNSCDNSDLLGAVVTGGALNGTSTTILPVTGFSLTGNHTNTPFNTCSGNNSDPDCTGPATEFFVQLKDQFNNLVGANTTVSDTTGNVECTQLFSSYTGPGGQHNCLVDSDNAPTTAAPDTVTDTWTTQSTTWGANADTSAGAPALVPIVNASNVTKTDSFTIDLYSVDLTHLGFAFHAVPGNVVKTGTTVHDEVTATDQYTNPVEGLFVTFDQSGPGAGVDTRSDDFTDPNGTASDNFSSSIQGDATVTADVYKNCFQFTGNEGEDCTGTTGGVPLFEQVNSIGFDGVPSIAVTPASAAGKHAVTIFGVTRPGASIQLQAGIGGGTFINIGAPQTADADGGYSYTLNVSKTTTFQVVADTIQTSVTRTATVTAVVKTAQHPTLALKALTGKNAGKVRVTITTHPNDHGATVTYYRVQNGVASLIRTSTIASGGRSAHTFSFGLNAHVSIRAKVAAHGNQKAGKTRTKSVNT